MPITFGPFWTLLNTTLLFGCLPGYAPYTPAVQYFTTTVTAASDFLPTPDCVNINDCSAHSCGAKGVCVDDDSLVGVPLQDYHCACSDGYDTVLEDLRSEPARKEKVCMNIDDCPTTNACSGENAAGSPRGLCADLFQNYTCTCVTGYSLVSLNWNLSCSPVKCGLLAEINNSVCSQSGHETDYDTPAWTHKCVEGYTLNGLAGST